MANAPASPDPSQQPLSIPRMGVDPEKMKSPKPAPMGWYDLRLLGFRPELDKAKTGINFNAQLEIANNTSENNGKKVFLGMSTKFPRLHVDFAHGFGFPMNADGTIPGQFDKDPSDPTNVSKYQYKGPLLGKIMKAELYVTVWQGVERNEINQIMCKVDQCAVKFPEVRHMTKIIKKG